jgi:hypothetical protein
MITFVALWDTTKIISHYLKMQYNCSSYLNSKYLLVISSHIYNNHHRFVEYKGAFNFISIVSYT